MQRVRRSRMSASDKAAIWDRWTRGESLSEIGRAIDRIPGGGLSRGAGSWRHPAAASLAFVSGPDGRRA